MKSTNPQWKEYESLNDREKIGYAIAQDSAMKYLAKTYDLVNFRIKKELANCELTEGTNCMINTGAIFITELLINIKNGLHGTSQQDLSLIEMLDDIKEMVKDRIQNHQNRIIAITDAYLTKNHLEMALTIPFNKVCSSHPKMAELIVAATTGVKIQFMDGQFYQR